VPGISERIRVRSVVGRFLEHSRVYWFANGGQDDLYLGSADLMERNLNRRVEAVSRVLDTAIVRHIRDVVLEAYLRDSDAAYLLDGQRYAPATADGVERANAQQQLLDWYISRPQPVDSGD
jgi:polyphosphate kinase